MGYSTKYFRWLCIHIIFLPAFKQDRHFVLPQSIRGRGEGGCLACGRVKLTFRP